MHHPWPFLWLVWSAAVVVYFVLSFVVAGRLRRSKEKSVVDVSFWVVVVLTLIRIVVRLLLHRGKIYQFSVLSAGVGAGIATLVMIWALIKQKLYESTDQSSTKR
jgi:hypothetical protein